MKILEKHFIKYFDNNEEIISINLTKECCEFKVVRKHLKIQDLLERTISNKNRFPLLLKLLEIVALLPASTSSCERGFSQMNLIKGKLRSSMNPSTLNDLLMIHMNGPSLQDFIPAKSVNKYILQPRQDTMEGIRSPHVHEL
jgi:hypothetical protein